MSSAASQAGTSEASEFGFSFPDLGSDFIADENAATANNVTRGNILEAQQYDTQMADTVYQRGRADMVAAGLNPILAAGSPDPMASSPMASAAMAQPQGNVNLGNTSSSTASPATVALQNAQTQTALANSAKATADAVNTGVQTGLLNLQEPKAAADANVYRDPVNAKALSWVDAMGSAGINKSTASGIAAEAAFTAGVNLPSDNSNSAYQAQQGAARDARLEADPANGLGTPPPWANGTGVGQ